MSMKVYFASLLVLALPAASIANSPNATRQVATKQAASKRNGTTQSATKPAGINQAASNQVATKPTGTKQAASKRNGTTQSATTPAGINQAAPNQAAPKPTGPPTVTKSGAEAAFETRTFKFPANRVGTLYEQRWPDHPFIDDKPLGAAVGNVTVKIPAGSWIRLELTRPVFVNPKLIDELPVAGIDEVYVNFIGMDEDETKWCDAVVAKLGHFKELKGLQIERSDTSDAAVMRIGTLPKVVVMAIGLTMIHGACFKTFAKQFPNLISLDAGNTSLSDESMRGLAECKNLTRIILSHCAIGTEGIKNLTANPNIIALKLNTNTKINDSCIPYLLNLKKLRLLDLGETRVSGEGVMQLKQLHLRKLEIPESTRTPQNRDALLQLAKTVHFVSTVRKADKNMEENFSPLH